MKVPNMNDAEDRRQSMAIARWENEGGAGWPTDCQYGRRVETDTSWSIYHVFSGVPATFGGQSLVGLSRSAATEGMLALNRRNDGRRKPRAGRDLARR
jgi:hypothetical protein